MFISWSEVGRENALSISSVISSNCGILAVVAICRAGGSKPRCFGLVGRTLSPGETQGNTSLGLVICKQRGRNWNF